MTGLFANEGFVVEVGNALPGFARLDSRGRLSPHGLWPEKPELGLSFFVNLVLTNSSYRSGGCF
jgi:hypothetical protein